jgi:hypothetical protein
MPFESKNNVSITFPDDGAVQISLVEASLCVSEHVFAVVILGHIV